MKSIAEQRGGVSFPKINGERIYMLPFLKSIGLPNIFRHWQLTVDQMLDGIETDGLVYLMADQGFVSAGNMLRRPGVHIDGNWIEEIRSHRGDGGGGGHRPPPPPPSGGHRILETNELLLMASNVIGCKAYLGDYDFTPKPDGDCSHIDLSGMGPVLFEPNRCYAATVTTLHESIPQLHNAYRTLVRLNVPLH